MDNSKSLANSESMPYKDRPHSPSSWMTTTFHRNLVSNPCIHSFTDELWSWRACVFCNCTQSNFERVCLSNLPRWQLTLSGIIWIERHVMHNSCLVVVPISGFESLSPTLPHTRTLLYDYIHPTVMRACFAHTKTQKPDCSFPDLGYCLGMLYSIAFLFVDIELL
jgi:hypothetical protein